MAFKDNSKQAKDAIRKAKIQWLFQACILVEGQAVLLATVDTGYMRDQIDYVVDESRLIGYVGTPAQYAVYVEFGTGEFAENGNGRKGGWVYQALNGEWHFTLGQSPQPFLRPAFRDNKNKIESLAKKFLSRI